MSVLIELHLTYLRAAGMSANTIDDRRRLLIHADRALPLGVDTAAPDELVAYLANPDWSPATLATYFRHFAGFYRWATAGPDPWISFDPCAGLAKPRTPDSVPNPVTDEQLTTALQRSPANWATSITLAAYAGLRAGEIQRLKREHVNADYITIWHGKGNRTTAVPTHPEIWCVIEPCKPGLLVVGQRGMQMRFSRDQARYFRGIGLPGVHMHMFRHWFGTMLLRTGTDIRTVQTLMRHRSLQTTQGYLAVADERRVAAVAALPVFIPRQRGGEGQ
jgi:integrase